MLGEYFGAHSLWQHKTGDQFYVEKTTEENLEVTDLLCDDVSVFVCELLLTDLLPRNILNLVALWVGNNCAYNRLFFL